MGTVRAMLPGGAGGVLRDSWARGVLLELGLVLAVVAGLVVFQYRTRSPVLVVLVELVLAVVVIGLLVNWWGLR